MTRDIDILARTLYGEARGEYPRTDGGLAALIAVANVVCNRASERTWYGTSVADVCLKPFQFSCWNKGDPNRALIESVKAEQDALFNICCKVSENVINRIWPDLTAASNHYYATSMSTPPDWAKNQTPRFILGRHRFFKLNP